jgi:membrane glycosyltransferase
VRKAFEDCPLIEIVHFHECLRGELRSLRSNVAQLRSQVWYRAYHVHQLLILSVFLTSLSLHVKAGSCLKDWGLFVRATICF